MTVDPLFKGEWGRMAALRKEKVEKDFEIKGERKNMERNMRKKRSVKYNSVLRHVLKSFGSKNLTIFITVPMNGDAQKSSSHFHCLKCDYHCTDTNKVVAHRRQHQKMDSINAAGFEKYTQPQFCLVNGCGYSGKQTHYHCAKCQYAVLGLSQMEAHKFRHVNEND